MANREKFKVYEGVFDEITFRALFGLYGKYFDRLRGPINTGKEADVYLAEWGDKRVAIKIYRIFARLYKNIAFYIRDDPRFRAIGNKPTKVIFEWTKKEYKNLLRASSIGVRVPKAIAYNLNVLVMEFIGENDIAAPLAKYVPPKDPEAWKNKIYKWIIDMWEKKNMVHGDLSEWNILNFKEEPVIIDISQAVLKDHPLSLELLKRDVENITRWFNKLGVKDNTLKDWLSKIINETRI